MSYFGAFSITKFSDGLSVTYTSGYFLIFLAILFLFYFIVDRKRRWIVLLIGSILFSLACGIKTLMTAVLIAVISYYASLLMEHFRDQAKKKKAVFVAAVLILVGALACIKCISHLQLGAGFFAFPIGVSYYTFSAISYIADVYLGRDKPTEGLFRYILFVLYFPKFLEGPIERHKDWSANYTDGSGTLKPFDYREFCFGLQLAVWGYFKKMVIADRISVFMSASLAGYENYGGFLMFLTTVLSVLQLYCDFSGCMDIVRGISQAMGITIAENFNHPLFALNAEDFWRRWHVTLNKWFKDYVYLPVFSSSVAIKCAKFCRKHVSKNFSRKVPTLIPLCVVWMLTGLWHGTGMHYLAWGLYWMVIFASSVLLKDSYRKLTKRLHINTEAASWKAFQMIRTFLLFAIGRLIAMPGDLGITAEVIRKFFCEPKPWEMVDGTLLQFGLDGADWAVLLIGILLLYLVEYLQTKYTLREMIAGWNLPVRMLAYSLPVIVIFIFGIYGPGYSAASFAYVNF